MIRFGLLFKLGRVPLIIWLNLIFKCPVHDWLYSLNEVDTLVCVLLEVQHFKVRIALHFQQPFFSFRFSVVEQHRFHQKFDRQQRKKKERYEIE